MIYNYKCIILILKKFLFWEQIIFFIKIAIYYLEEIKYRNIGILTMIKSINKLKLY